jgi:hypothetical protein
MGKRYSGAPQRVRLSFAAQRISMGTSHCFAAGFRLVVPRQLRHCLKPAHARPSSSTVTKPEQGVMSDSMPIYVSFTWWTSRPALRQCT